MSEVVKKHHIEIRVGLKSPRVYTVPKDIVNGLEKILRQYLTDKEENVLPDEVFKQINKKYSKIGNILIGFRLRDGLTQAQLAEEIGSSQPTIAAIENGTRSIGKSLAAKLAKVFKTNYKVFLKK